ncbi:lupus La protein homolog B-like [Dendronephthya gigantea]|uniref:lupus La protein homolog B-like n=1 Tax=Dendronephthya gigantea TaxID=151771 RepID=UPI00106D5609|nr:lupus La protein homolog B-like [Dendronephthya gigantea]
MSSPEKSASFEKKIAKQIEYYFGDKNLPKDKFLLQKLEEDNGWVTMDCLMTFARLKTMVYDLIGHALRTHGTGLMEINEENTKMRRVKPMPEINMEYNLASRNKSIYCKGFPESTTLDELEEFFESKGKCVNIVMRRTYDEKKNFKGSVFVEFETKDEAVAFVASKDLKFKDNELTYMSKEDYFKGKRAESKNGEHGATPTKDHNKSTDKEDTQKDEECPKGRVIHFAGAGDQTTREDIKETFSLETYKVRWVDFSIGDKEGFIRYENDGDAEKALKAVLEKNENKVNLRGVETTLRVIEGDEEKGYWKKSKEEFDKHRQRNKRGGKRQQHWKHGKRGRHDGHSNDEPPVKQAKPDT